VGGDQNQLCGAHAFTARFCPSRLLEEVASVANLAQALLKVISAGLTRG
jgi:hypothetical protein